eukprot:TRINITY_DN17145_c1_g1_i1.p1 TRINITY_DN17145_c1_g1~~TRINITY_DN17145_c1_g1_i1.p1  ORF type:complete len:633 (-),score=117.72 TRINITY_DN17145_c1_g1_i1:22-1920(-)
MPRKSTTIEFIDFSKNTLTDVLWNNLNNCNPQSILLSFNNITSLPINITLKHLDLSYNQIKWNQDDFPFLLIEYLNLAHNNISTSLQLSSNPKIKELNLAHNLITGNLNGIYRDIKFYSLNLNNNLLSGTIPPYNFYTSFLPGFYLYLNTNSISGKLDLSTYKDLIEFDIGNNQLTGTLPQEIPSTLKKLNLEQNFLFGTIPSKWEHVQPTDINFKGNNFCGCIPDKWSLIKLNSCILFDSLDCKCNIPTPCSHSCDKTIVTSLCGKNQCILNNTLCSSQRSCQPKLKNNYYNGYECLNCSGYYTNDGEFNCAISSELWIIIFLSTVIPAVIILLIIVYLVWRYKAGKIIIEFDSPELKDFFNMDNLESRRFALVPNSDIYSKKLDSNDDEYKVFLKLRETLDFGEMDLASVHAIIAPNQVYGFSNEKKVIEGRHNVSPEMFKSTKWKAKKNELKQWTFDSIDLLISSNCFQSPGILPAVHGTSETVAWKIAKTGFAPLQTLDAGFYGKGIYLSTSARYITPYFARSNKPAILICLTLPGNPYPVTESKNDKDSLFGNPILQGYQSHYVKTTKKGLVCRNMTEISYDELIVDHHTQILPMFLVTIRPEILPDLLRQFERETPNNDEVSILYV